MGSPPYKLMMQEDNQLCVYGADMECIWCTGTWEGRYSIAQLKS